MGRYIKQKAPIKENIMVNYPKHVGMRDFERMSDVEKEALMMETRNASEMIKAKYGQMSPEYLGLVARYLQEHSDALIAKKRGTSLEPKPQVGERTLVVDGEEFKY
jgi:hypothetical protein